MSANVAALSYLAAERLHSGAERLVEPGDIATGQPVRHHRHAQPLAILTTLGLNSAGGDVLDPDRSRPRLLAASSAPRRRAKSR